MQQDSAEGAPIFLEGDESAVALPEEAMAREETQEEFVRCETAYPLYGRPFGLAFVWANSYMDSRGATQLEVSIDSAAMVAEVLQQSGYEVRTRTNLRKRYILDELTPEQLTELHTTYDTVLVYFCGRGNGHAFYTQAGDEMVTVKEIWERFDAAGMQRGKARVMIMDLFELKSSAEEDFLSELEVLTRTVAGHREDLELMRERDQQPPDSMLNKVNQLEQELADKEALRLTLRHPPAAGLTARIAVMKHPLRAPITKIHLKVKSLGYAIGVGVCEPEGLCRVHSEGIRAYSALNDFLGSCNYGWGFNEIGYTWAVSEGKASVPPKAWQKRAHIRPGDDLELTLDQVEGVVRLAVAGKFNPADIFLSHPLLASPEGRELRGAVALYGLGDEVEVLGVQEGARDHPDELRDVRLLGWDRTCSAEDLRFEGRVAERVEGEGLPEDADSVYVLLRQPLRFAPAGYNARKEPVGQVALGVYSGEATVHKASVLAHSLCARLRQAASSPPDPDHPHKDLQSWLPKALQEDLDAHVVSLFVRSQCGLSGPHADTLLQALRDHNVGVDGLKLLPDKAAVQALSIPRSLIDTVFQGVLSARNAASTSVQALQLWSKHTCGPRRLLLNGPALAWSRRHTADAFAVSPDGRTASKTGQTRGSCTVMCSLASQLRVPRKYGAVLPGGGRHSWEFAIDALRSSQGGERANAGSIRLGLVQAQAILDGRYAVRVGQCRGGTTTTAVLDEGASDQDTAYEGLTLQVLHGQGAGQSSRVFGYTAIDRTVDIVLEVGVDASSVYCLTRLEGFEVGDDAFSWAVSSSSAGRTAAIHGDPSTASYKGLEFQGAPSELNRVSARGSEAPGTFPSCLGDPLKEGDVVTVWLDLDNELMAVSLNGAPLGSAVKGVHGILVPALSCAANTDVAVTLRHYRRWAPEGGWAAGEAGLSLTEEEVGELRAAFRRFDAGSALIDKKNIRPLLTAVGLVMTGAELEAVVESVDEDGSNSIDLTEFLGLMSGFKDSAHWSLAALAPPAPPTPALPS